MQRFTLIHDGSSQGWQAAYLAFRITALLGAPLLVLIDSATDQKALEQTAVQVEIGGRAAGVVIDTRFVADFSVEVVAGNADDSDGLFIPQSLLSDEKTAAAFLEVLSCPIWVVSHESESHKMGVLVDDLAADEKMITYTTALSHRLLQPLIGVVQEEKFPTIPQSDPAINWILLPILSPEEIITALDEQNIDILFVSSSSTVPVKDLDLNFVLFPASEQGDA